MRSYNLNSPRITRKSQILNAAIDQVKQDFCKRVMHILHNRIIEEKYLINMDQTNLYLNLAPQTAVHRKGERAVFVQLRGSSSRLPLCVAAAKDGAKLRLFVVMKGEPGGRIEKSFRSGVVHDRDFSCHYKCDSTLIALSAHYFLDENRIFITLQ